MRTQYQLGRNEFVMNQIIMDSKMSLQEELTELNVMPENFINCIYYIAYDDIPDKVKIDFTPDSEYTTEVADFKN